MRGLWRCLRLSGTAVDSWQACSSSSPSDLAAAYATAAAAAAVQQQQWLPRIFQQTASSMSYQVQQQQQQQQRVLSSWQGMDDGQRHSTTILCVRRGSEVVIIGDGQATQNDFIVKSNVRKVRRIGPAAVGGFAGVAVDGLALLERLEKKLEEHPGQLQRAAVELAKMWRQDKLLRELDASLIVADAQMTLWLMGNGDVLEAGADGIIGIGSGADFAESAARALMQLHHEKHGEKDSRIEGIEQDTDEIDQKETTADAAAEGISSSSSSSSSGLSADVVYGPDMSLMQVAQAAMKIAADCCIYTNPNFSWYHIKQDGEIEAGGGAAAAAATTAAAAAAKATA